MRGIGRVVLGTLILAFLGHIGCSSRNGGSGDAANGGASGSASGVQQESLRRVIVLTNGDDPFWDAMRAGMQDADRDLKLAEHGLHAELDKNDGTSKGQVDKLKQYAGQTDIAAIAISVTDARNVAIQEAMRKLRSQGVQVITIDSDVDRSDPGKAAAARFAYLGTDNIIGGRCLGKAARGLLPAGGEFAAFVGIKSTANAQERVGGFIEAAGDKFKEVDYLADEFDLSTAQKNVRDALDRHPDLKILVGIWSYNAHAIAQTVKDRGNREKVVVVTFDASPKAVAHMAEGYIDAMVVQNPYQMGYDGVKLMQALVKDDQETIGEMFPAYEPDERSFTKPDGDVLITGLKVIVPDGDKRLNATMFDGMAEFLTLGQFQDWLKKYKLSGS